MHSVYMYTMYFFRYWRYVPEYFFICNEFFEIMVFSDLHDSAFDVLMSSKQKLLFLILFNLGNSFKTTNFVMFELLFQLWCFSFSEALTNILDMEGVATIFSLCTSPLDE